MQFEHKFFPLPGRKKGHPTEKNLCDQRKTKEFTPNARLRHNHPAETTPIEKNRLLLSCLVSPPAKGPAKRARSYQLAALRFTCRKPISGPEPDKLRNLVFLKILLAMDPKKSGPSGAQEPPPENKQGSEEDAADLLKVNASDDEEDDEDYNKNGSPGTSEKSETEQTSTLESPEKKRRLLAKDGPHVLEHVHSLSGNLENRIEHWNQCLLQIPDKPLAMRCAKAEKSDCLSTVYLAFAEIDWTDCPLRDSIVAEQNGVSTQMPVPDYVWERQTEEEFLKNLLYDKLDRSLDLHTLYRSSQDYAEAALKRMKAVEHVVSRADTPTASVLIKTNGLFKLLRQALLRQCPDPRDELVNKVALYHWILKSDLSAIEPLPMA